jgi:hypothetical protein
MASHSQMSRTAANANAVQTMASVLLTATDAGWTDWELDFLEHMREHTGPEPISMRQREVLFELNDKARSYRDYRGIPVSRLLAECWMARLDLDEDDEVFVSTLHAANPTALKRRALFRLVHIASKLTILDDSTRTIG